MAYILLVMHKCNRTFSGFFFNILVVRRATRPPNLVAQNLFLVVAGVRTLDLSRLAVQLYSLYFPKLFLDTFDQYYEKYTNPDLPWELLSLSRSSPPLVSPAPPPRLVTGWI